PPALDQPLGGQVSPIPDLLRQNQLWSRAGLQRQHVLGDRLTVGERQVPALAAEDGPGTAPPGAARRPGSSVVGLAVGIADVAAPDGSIDQLDPQWSVGRHQAALDSGIACPPPTPPPQ